MGRTLLVLIIGLFSPFEVAGSVTNLIFIPATISSVFEVPIPVAKLSFPCCAIIIPGSDEVSVAIPDVCRLGKRQDGNYDQNNRQSCCLHFCSSSLYQVVNRSSHNTKLYHIFIKLEPLAAYDYLPFMQTIGVS